MKLKKKKKTGMGEQCRSCSLARTVFRPWLTTTRLRKDLADIRNTFSPLCPPTTLIGFHVEPEAL